MPYSDNLSVGLAYEIDADYFYNAKGERDKIETWCHTNNYTIEEYKQERDAQSMPDGSGFVIIPARHVVRLIPPEG